MDTFLTGRVKAVPYKSSFAIGPDGKEEVYLISLQNEMMLKMNKTTSVEFNGMLSELRKLLAW